MYKQFTLWLSILCLPVIAFAQLQSPDQFLPHHLGETFTPHHIQVDYFQHLAVNSPNIKLVEYGRTEEGRPLLLAFISTEENLANLEAIRQNHLRHCGLEEGGANPDLDRAIVWFSYSVHGNEAGGAEASMAVAYDLANTNNATAQEWLKNTIVIIDPATNPDGYDHYTHWYRSVATKRRDVNPDVREHNEPWPGGRVNHYMFDLNRDWAWQTQVESQQRIVYYKKWMPHIHADLHEQYYYNPYYFAPAAQPYHAYITEWQGDFQTEIGKNHARYFDENGWLYFTREEFDLLYPSYGDTYPLFNGSIGMTYEQAGHSKAGNAILMPNTDTLTLYDRVKHHKTTSLSTVEMASKNAARLVRQLDDYFKRATNSPTGPYKTYIIKGTNPQPRIQALLTLLDRNGIRYGRANGKGSINAYDYQTGKTKNIAINHNDLVISAFQPRSVLTQVLFDPSTELVDSLTYDITAWSLPYAYGLEAYATTSQTEVKDGYNTGVYKNNLGENSQPYAYLVPWESTQEARFLGQLLQAGIQVRTSSSGFQLNGKIYDRGTLVINRGDNRKNPDFDAIVRATARNMKIRIDAVSTGFTDNGPDFGSGTMTLLKAPNIAMLAGKNTFVNETGQVWHYFENRLDYPIHLLDPGQLKSWNENDYDVLILPEGTYNINGAIAEKLNNWIKNGGKLIAIGAALRSLEGKSGFGLEAKSYNDDSSPNTDANHDYANAERRSIASYMPGAVFEVQMDNSHPLAYGFKDTYFSLKTSSSAYELLEDGWNVGQLDDKPMVTGFVGYKAKKSVLNSLVFGVEDSGRGSIVYFVDNPLYRGFWENGIFLFSNAVFMVGN